MIDPDDLRPGDLLIFNDSLADLPELARTASGRTYAPGDRIFVADPATRDLAGIFFVRCLVEPGVDLLILPKYLSMLARAACECDLWVGPCRCAAGRAELAGERRRLYGFASGSGD